MKKATQKKKPVKTNELTYEPQEHELKYIKCLLDDRKILVTSYKSRNTKKK